MNSLVLYKIVILSIIIIIQFPKKLKRSCMDVRSAAGSAVASRLAENFTVLLLEAGGNPTPSSDIPFLYFDDDSTKSEILRHYESAPNNYSCLSAANQSCKILQGSALGGSTTINAMIFARGSKQDYEDWKSYGNDGWGYDDVLPYFKKLENHGFDNDYHSSSGPVPAEPFGTTPHLDYIKKVLCDSYEEIGVPHNDDVNGERQIGCTFMRGTITNGTRANSAKNYLKNLKKLKVVKHALVEKIEIENGIAVEVVFRRHCRVFRARVQKEIILSAGAIRSPQILMLSGVGPKEELEKHGIPWKVNSPGVGQNLQDHYFYYGLTYRIKTSGGTPSENTADAFYEYLRKRTGLYASLGVTDTYSYVDTSYQSDVPDINVVHSYIAGDITNSADQPGGKDLLSIIPLILQPKSRGEILLKSANISDHPIIRTNCLSDSEDIDVLIRGIELVKNVTKSAKFSVLEPDELLITIDACSKLAENSTEYLECQIRHLGSNAYHIVGTCKMGPSTDPGAVVDNELRVFGVSNLRMADCSIMPKITRGNTAVPAMMIGERAADFIKTKWR